MNYLENVLAAFIGGASAIVYGVLKFIRDTLNNNEKERELYQRSFDSLVSQLTSDNVDVQLSAAILLRRYFREIKNKKKDLHIETINVISSILRILPSGVFQKTLADSLASATDLSMCDLQRTNMQDALLDNRNKVILMNKSDLFMADLSFANLKNIKGHGIIFYDAILLYARIRNCDFTNANMRGANLTGVMFRDCILKGADFTDAINIPTYIKNNLDRNNKFKLNGKVSVNHETIEKNIFFSMPGVLAKEDEMITKNYKEFLEKSGYRVIYYKRDDYPRYGQLNRVKEAIHHSCGMIAFGFKQIYIYRGQYRPSSVEESAWNDKWLSTPWNEIEVGMGMAIGMPILLVRDPIISDGVFDDGLSECFVARVLSTEDSRRLEYNKSFQNWFSKL